MINPKTVSAFKAVSSVLIVLLIAGFIAPVTSAAIASQNRQSDQYRTTVTVPGTSADTALAANNGDAEQGGQFGSENATVTNQTISSDGNQNTNNDHLQTETNGFKKQYSKPETTPKGETAQIRAQEQTLFQYRNMTMLMNCTRNCTVIFTADEEVEPKMFSLTVDPNQTMTLAMNLTKNPLNGALVNERCLNFYLGIEPNATLQLQAQIRLYINQTELNQNMNREVNTSRLTWMYWNQTQSQWEKVESHIDQSGYLACDTNHFSTWTVAEEVPAQEVTDQQTTVDTMTLYIVIAVIAAIIVVGLGVVFAYKKRK